MEVNNLTTTSIDEGFLQKIAELVLQTENRKNSDFSLAFVGEGRMRQINKKFRGKNRVTDVLSFPETKISLEKFKVGGFSKTENLGEIIICIREVKKNSRRFGCSFQRELARVLIHGIFHLLGYDHTKSRKDAEYMQEKEKFYLSQLGL